MFTVKSIGTCLIQHTKGPEKCVGLYRITQVLFWLTEILWDHTFSSDVTGCRKKSCVGFHRFHCMHFSFPEVVRFLSYEIESLLHYNSLWLQSTKLSYCPLELFIVQVTISKYNAINSSCFINPKFLTDYIYFLICMPL